MPRVIISVILFNPEFILLKKLISPFINFDGDYLFVFRDHSKFRMNDLTIFDGLPFQYYHDPSNPGFGTGHNNNFKVFGKLSEYFLVCNPDIQFSPQNLEKLLDYLSRNSDIGIVMPSIFYPDGRNQRLAKLLPSPLTLLARRIPYLNILIDNYTLDYYKYNFILDVPFLSGCFMIFPNKIFEMINGFDQNYFMYFEDIDICRKVRSKSFRTVIVPYIDVIHNHSFKSIFNVVTLKSMLKSSIYYFNKWGWFFDNKRFEDNSYTLARITQYNFEKISN